MGSARGQFDEQLFILKLSPISRQMQEDGSAVKLTRGSFKNQIDAQIDVLSKYLASVDQLCREVWQVQGHEITPEFVRNILLTRILQSIGGRESSLKGSIDMRHWRSPNGDTQMERHYLAMAFRQLKATVKTRYEVEARELGYKAEIGSVASRNERAPGMFLEGGHGSSSTLGAVKTFEDYSDISTETLQKLRDQRSEKSRYLTEKYPRWEMWGSGYGPGNTPPLYYNEIRRLEQQLDEADVELSRRMNAISGLNANEKSKEFTHSADYRSVGLKGQRYSLTSRQAQVVELLHTASSDGNPELGKDYILEHLETPSSRLRDTFKTNQSAWKALIKRGERRGTYRLNL
jgi:hypothetical protein